MPIRSLHILFRVSVIGFLAGGAVIVLGQLLGIALGNADWVAAVEEHAGPPTFIVAGVSGLIAFVLSYLKTEDLPTAPADPRDLQPATGHGPR
ncbi:hypothetical protein CG723_09470 [Streptomyces sp. CB01635]|uniref:hypothetical protein n=1 Tax=unclassified Streptomyces TaxID=2593676 RepID=UPI000C275D35|nr:hypothetical protein [Streptomyces sp. CB01635]PJN11169.1 hypothetical protein CG723_09470 [Streptomyces sp. CB01635]